MTIRVPLWLHRPLKRFLLYWVVVLVAVPAGILCLLLLRFLPQTIALSLSVALGLVAAYFAWTFTDKRISFAPKESPSVITYQATSGVRVLAPAYSFGVAGCLMLIAISTPSRAEQEAVDHNVGVAIHIKAQTT
jgi:putative flippase GtrA